MPTTTQKWYKDLDISSEGFPVGIDEIDSMSSSGICYCIIANSGIVERADVFENGKKAHYKVFGYDKKGRVIENTMYTPDNNGNWIIADSIWYYEYDPATGLRSKKIMQMPGASTATEITYDQSGNRTNETLIPAYR